MSDISEEVTAKLGPLPVWAWGGIAAAVSLGGYYLYKRVHPVAAVSGTADASGAPDLSGGTSAAVAGLYSTAGIPPQAQSISSSGDIASWITRSAQAVAGNLGKSPSDILAALQLWSEGQPITSAQKTYVDEAIQLQGQPPSLPTGTSSVSDPAPAPTAQYFGRDGNGVVYEELSDGTRKGLTLAEYQALGSPRFDLDGHDHYRPGH